MIIRKIHLISRGKEGTIIKRDRFYFVFSIRTNIQKISVGSMKFSLSLIITLINVNYI